MRELRISSFTFKYLANAITMNIIVFDNKITMYQSHITTKEEQNYPQNEPTRQPLIKQ